MRTVKRIVKRDPELIVLFTYLLILFAIYNVYH